MVPYYDTNTLLVTLNNGIVQRIDLNDDLNPWRTSSWPMTWNLSASFFKAIRINERFTAGLNADVFNVLNMPGITLPDPTTGIIANQRSQNAGRNLQMTLRLQW